METTASTSRAALLNVIREAEQLLQASNEYFTKGAKIDILDLLQSAKQSLQSTASPFTRNRQFYKYEDADHYSFHIDRFTMVPPFQRDGDVYTRYGLVEALAWLKQQHLLAGGLAQTRGRAELALHKAAELLQQAKVGEQVGNYPANSLRSLKAATDKLSAALNDPAATQEQLATAAVKCFNELRACRHSRILRTDADPFCSLYMNDEELGSLKATIHNDPFIASYYERIKALSAQFTLDELQRSLELISDQQADYDELNQHFYLWSSTDKIVNFQAPQETAYGKISFILPSIENETDGLGHVWIDNVQIHSASEGQLTIHNHHFEEGDGAPLYWIPVARKGTPIMKWEDQYPFNRADDSSSSAHSIYMCNPTDQDEASWEYSESLPLISGNKYTLMFDAKIDGKLMRGIKTVLTFYNERHEDIGQFDYYFNRKSSIAGGRYQLAMQCDAIQYHLTRDRYYAEKVKAALLFIFNDFCQGAEHWMITNLRPEGSDNYGAVQAGRLLSVAAVSYSMIKPANVFTAAEKDRFYGLIKYMLRYVLDLRDRAEWMAYEAQRGCSNWQTDMCAGAGLMMMVLTDFPDRLSWLYNAETILKAQLALNVNGDSSWPESIRYHVAALERFAGYAKICGRITGEDWFATSALVPMFEYLVAMQTPAYPYFNHSIGTPPFGDHALTAGAEYGCFPVYISEVEKIDKGLADRMFLTWKAAGMPVKKLWGEGIVFENLISSLLHYEVTTELTLASTASYPDSGIYIFRNHMNTDKQSYFAIMSSPNKIAHGHLDQGSFILYKNSIPLVMDTGIEGYFDSSTQWHISSYSHACVQFSTNRKAELLHGVEAINLSAGTYSLERGWVDVPVSSRVINVTLTDQLDTITIEIDNPEGAGKHIRHVTYIKRSELYIIKDTVEQFAGDVLFSLPIAALDARIEHQSVVASCPANLNLDVHFVSELQSLTLDTGRSTHFFAGDDTSCSYMTYVRAVAAASSGFLTILAPREADQAPIHIVAQSTDSFIIQDAAHQHQIKINSGDNTITVY